MIFLRRLLLFVLVVSLLPGVTELPENLEHLLHDGHLAHSALHDDHGEEEHADEHASLEAEHGCTPLTHHCGCHSSIAVVLPEDTQAHEPRFVVLTSRVHPALDRQRVDRANAPPLPPPLA